MHPLEIRIYGSSIEYMLFTGIQTIYSSLQRGYLCITGYLASKLNNKYMILKEICACFSYTIKTIFMCIEVIRTKYKRKSYFSRKV